MAGVMSLTLDKILIAWVVLAMPAALFVGAFMKAGKGGDQ